MVDLANLWGRAVDPRQIPGYHFARSTGMRDFVSS